MKTFALALLVSLPFASAQAAPHCPVDEVKKLPELCKQEVALAIDADRVAKAFQETLTKEYRLAGCNQVATKDLKWEYVFEDAVGPYLKVAIDYTCEEGEAVGGYEFGGHYYLDATSPSFQLLNFQLYTYE